MPVFVDKSKCCYCGACVGVCPKLCLTLIETEILVDNSNCISCYACVKVCPVAAIQPKEKEVKK